MHSTPRYQRHFHLREKQKETRRKSHDRRENTYSSLCSMHSGKDDSDDASADGIDNNAACEDEELDEAILIEVFGFPYSIFFPPLYTVHFAHQIEGLQRPQHLQSFSNAFTDASRGVREDTALALSPMLKRARSTCPAPGRAFITGLLRFDDARKHFEKSSYQNYELNMAYAKLEVCMFPRTLFLLACCIIR